MDVNANNVYINGQMAGQGNMPGSSTTLPDDVWAAFTAGNPQVVAAVEEHADAVAALADAELALADSLLAESFMGPGVEININVEGTVISEGDLAEIITDIQYEYQKTGKGILYDPIAI
jgi:hypothetical protein